MGHTLFKVTPISVGSTWTCSWSFLLGSAEVPACREAEPGLGGPQRALEPREHPNLRVSQPVSPKAEHLPPHQDQRAAGGGGPWAAAGSGVKGWGRFPHL